MIFQYLGNGGRLAVNGERLAVSGEGGGERICNPTAISWWTSADYDISHLSKDLFAS